MPRTNIGEINLSGYPFQVGFDGNRKEDQSIFSEPTPVETDFHACKSLISFGEYSLEFLRTSTIVTSENKPNDGLSLGHPPNGGSFVGSPFKRFKRWTCEWERIPNG